MRINFATGGYIIVKVFADSTSQTSVPPAPSVSYDVGSNKEKKRAQFIEKLEFPKTANSTPLSLFIVWNDIVPFPTAQDAYTIVGNGAFGQIAYASQFVQMISQGTQNPTLIPHYVFSAYAYTGTINLSTGEPNGDGDYLFDPPWRYRYTWYENQGSSEIIWGERYPGIPDPSNPYYRLDGGFNSLSEAQNWADAYAAFWADNYSRLTTPPNYSRAKDVFGNWVQKAGSPLQLYAAEVPLQTAKGSSLFGLYLFRIPGGWQDQLTVTVNAGAVSNVLLSVLGYSDVIMKDPKIAKFNVDEPSRYPQDVANTWPSDRDLGAFSSGSQDNFELRDGGFNTNAPSTVFTINTQIRPTLVQSKPHAVDIGVVGGKDDTTTGIQ